MFDVEGRDRVVSTIEELLVEVRAGIVWENDTLERYLDGLAELLGSIELSYVNVGEDVPSDPWTIIDHALRGAREYE